jgi:HEAT repeat protein
MIVSKFNGTTREDHTHFSTLCIPADPFCPDISNVLMGIHSLRRICAKFIYPVKKKERHGFPVRLPATVSRPTGDTGSCMSVFAYKPDIRHLETNADIDGLTKALQHPEKEIRLGAARALANFSSVDACPALITCFKDEDAEVREASVDTLVAMGETALPLLFNAMGDQSWLVRRGAAQALTGLQYSPDDDEIRVCFLFAQGSWDELAAFKKKAIPYLIEGLKDEYPGIRKGAASSLGKISDPEGFEPLTRAISDPDLDVRIAAALALGAQKDPRAIPFLTNLFYDSNPQVRNGAADALALIGIPAFEPLTAALNDAKPHARLAAIRALAKIQDPRVIPPLVSKLEDAFPEMRTTAATALGEMGAPALPRVLEVMKKGSRIARLACLDAFAKSLDPRVTEVLEAAIRGTDQQIAKKAEVIIRKREGLKVWQTALDDDSQSPTTASTAELWNIKQERKAFEQLGSQETDKLVAILRDDDQNSRLRAVLRRVNEGRPVVEALVLLMKHKDEEIKRRAVEAIDRLEDISGNPLMVALNDNDPFIRAVATRNLGKLGWMDAIVPLLRHACEDKDNYVQGSAGEAITRMGMLPDLKMPVADALIRALTDESVGIRTKAAELLGNMGSTVAIPHLVSLFRDRNEEVQVSAAEALAEIGKPAFPALAQAANDPDSRVRRGALTALGDFGKKGETYLLEALHDSNPDIRAHAQKIISEQKTGGITISKPKAGIAGLKEEQAHPHKTAAPPAPAAPEKTPADPRVFIAKLASRNKNERALAMKNLVAMGETAFHPLIFAAYDPEPSQRIGALQALSHFGTMGAPHIVKALEDPDIDVQHAAYRILNHLDGKYGLPKVGGPALSVGTPGGAPEGMVPAPEGRAGPRPVKPEKIYPADIIPHLADPGEERRMRAAEVLVKMGDVAFLPLVYAAYHPDPAMRAGAFFALSQYGERGAPYIIRGLDDTDLSVQHAVYRILREQDGRFGLPRVGGPTLAIGTPVSPGSGDAIPVPAPAEVPGVSVEGITDPHELVELLGHASKDTQMNAAMALAMMGGTAVPALIGAFASANRDARATAAEIIGSLGPDAYDPLVRALDDPRSDVVSGAASVLGKLGDKRAVPALIALLDKNQNGTGIIAAEALGYLGDAMSVEALIRALNGTDSELQSGAARALGYIGDERAVSSLIEAMGSPDFSVRQIAIDALTGIGEPAIPYISEALLHSERGVRSGAAECFMQIGYVPKTGQEEINLLVANEEWFELTKRGETAVEVLLYFIDDANGEVRAGALAALGKVGGLRAAETLAGLLADDDPVIRRQAIGSLAEMGGSAVPGLNAAREKAASPALQRGIDDVLKKIQERKTSGSTHD